MLRIPDWFPLFKKGEEQAFRKVYEKYYRPVCYFASKILHNDLYVEDVVSETFRKAWEARAKFASERYLVNFLYLVTRNDCLNKLRRNRTMQRTNEEWVQLAMSDTPVDGVMDLERTQALLITSILEKLETLPGGEVLRMCFLEGKSTREVALELNTTENNVYILKSRCLKALKSSFTGLELLVFFGFLGFRGFPTDDLLQSPELSSLEKHATYSTGIPAAFLRFGQTSNRYQRD